jgi:hypothetical protein
MSKEFGAVSIAFQHLAACCKRQKQQLLAALLLCLQQQWPQFFATHFPAPAAYYLS